MRRFGQVPEVQNVGKFVVQVIATNSGKAGDEFVAGELEGRDSCSTIVCGVASRNSINPCW
jgi:hypothetical protein